MKNKLLQQNALFIQAGNKKSEDLMNTFLQYLVTRKLNVGSQKSFSEEESGLQLIV